MRVLGHNLLLAAVAFACSSLQGPVVAAGGPAAPITAAPGTLVRWSAPGTTRCGMLGRTWAALQETCYYPIDLLQKPGVVVVARMISGRRETARIAVGPFAYGTEAIELPDIPQADPSADDLKRNSRDQVLLGKVWARPELPARFTLPLGDPAKPLPEGQSFGVKRVFNGKPAAQPHTGCDYATPMGSPILAAADGTVVVAEDLFFAGNAVFIDHGNGLVTMYFHLSEIKVAVGQEVAKGHTLGAVGSTGRSTGPHLFFGVRWHNARVDPTILLGAPADIPSVDAVAKPAGLPAPSRGASSEPVR
jgi:murein DD-endopeptidase MepM/ murein hydrolase activator NlpD